MGETNSIFIRKVFFMKKRICSTIAAQSAAKKRAVKSATKTVTVSVQRRKTHNEIRNEGFDNGVRRCAEAMLGQGDSRDDVADTFGFASIPFPYTEDTNWYESWAFEDWDDWAAAGESECDDE
jgi:hypothetical protein